jgi:hypothetical protein
MAKNDKSNQANNEPVVTSISETEWQTIYPDGMAVHSSISRPNTEADLLWLYQMVSTLAPEFKANAQAKAEKEAADKKQAA